MLTVGNSHLRQRIMALAQDKIFKDGECHGLTYIEAHSICRELLHVSQSVRGSKQYS
jgi:hypothetical protein